MESVVQKLFTWRTAITDSKLPPTTRHVLITLSLWMNEMGESAFPSTKKLSKATGLSERSVCTHLENAEKLGWIKKAIHGYSGQGWKRHEYTPLIPQDALNEVQHQGTEGDSARPQKCTEPHAEGTEPDSKNALNEVQSNTPDNSPSNTPIDIWVDPEKINQSAWNEFEQHRKEMREPLSDLARKKNANLLVGLNHEQQQRCIDLTISNRWKGLFPGKVTYPSAKKPPQPDKSGYGETRGTL